MANTMEEDKKVAYYSALVNAMITTSMEKDKQLLTLSALGIGAILTFITMGCNTPSHISPTLLLIPLVFFLTTIVSCLFIFGKNSEHLTLLNTRDNKIDNNQSADDENAKIYHIRKVFGWWDKIIFLSFILGVLSLCGFALLFVLK